jgi:hypothetical protein
MTTPNKGREAFKDWYYDADGVGSRMEIDISEEDAWVIWKAACAEKDKVIAELVAKLDEVDSALGVASDFTHMGRPLKDVREAIHHANKLLNNIIKAQGV